MGDRDLLFQGHLAILDLEFSQFGSCNMITRKVLLEFRPNLHRICILHGFKPDYILGDLGPMFSRSFGHAGLENWGSK